jgi:hypothetical protein
MHSNGKSTHKFAVGFLSPGQVRTQFFMSYVNFREFDLTHGNLLGAIIPQVGLYIAGMRNKVVKDFLNKTQLEWLLMMDSDHIFLPEFPHLLLQSAEDAHVRVMSALYFGVMNGRVSPMWFQRMPNGDFATVQEIREGIQEIGGFGCGMVLIHRSVFEEMAPHYQDDSWKWFAHDGVMYHGELSRYGEDICFCKRLGDLGIKMYGDARLVIGHEKTINLDLEMFLAIQKMQDKEDRQPEVVDPVV